MKGEILVTGSDFLNEFKNDVGFVSNLGDTTKNFTGSVMERVKVIKQLDVSWFSKSKDATATWTVDTTAGTLSSTTGDFIGDGFAVGDDFIYEEIAGGGGADFTAQITSINSNLIVFTLLSGSRTNTDTEAIIRGFSPLESLNYRFGLIGNSESFNVESKVSGNDQGYYGSSIGFDTGGGVRDTNFVNLQRIGTYADWQTGTVRARFVSDTYSLLTAQSGSQRFIIEHEFTILVYYVDGQLDNLKNKVIPDLFNGQNTLKYVYSPGFRTALNNPNTEKTVNVDNELGSLGWFEESFNGYANNYQVNAISYEDEVSGDPADGLLIGSKTTITIEVEKNNGNFSVGERAGVYVSYLPKKNEYTNTIITDFKENFLYDNALNNEGLAPVGGQDLITNFEITNLAANTMTITFDVEYSLAQKIRLSNLNAASPISFLVGVQLGDNTLTSENSDRAILIADASFYDSDSDIPGLMSFLKFDIYAHDIYIGVDAGSTDVTAWVEDGVAVDYTFELDLNKDAILNSLDFMLVAYDPVTKIFFEIDKYSFNIFPAVVSSGIQQLILNATRGYILESDDQFNKAEIAVGSNALGFQQYDGIIGQKFSWQDWIENLNVDTVFFDSSKPNNNLNLKSSNYSMLNGYEIRLAFFGNLSGTSVLGTSSLTNYLTLSPTLTVYNYEEDGNITPVWSQVIETFNQSATSNLGLSTLTGQNTLFRCTHTHSGGPVVSLVGLWAINRIEDENQPGYLISEMSTLDDHPANQLLIPTVGFTLLDIYLDSGNVVTECLIDGSLAQAGIKYNLSSRIGDGNPSLVDAKITEEGILKDTEQGIQKIIE